MRIARRLAPLLALIALAGCISATDAPVVQAERGTGPDVITRISGDGTARSKVFTLDGSYDTHWSVQRDGRGHCRPGHCLFDLTLMSTHHMFSTVTVVERYDPGSDVAPGWQQGQYYLHVYCPDGGHWTVEIRNT